MYLIMLLNVSLEYELIISLCILIIFTLFNGVELYIFLIDDKVKDIFIKYKINKICVKLFIFIYNKI